MQGVDERNAAIQRMLTYRPQMKIPEREVIVSHSDNVRDALYQPNK